jgi:hypothetical protein
LAPIWEMGTHYNAAIGGHIDVLEWLQDNDFPIDYVTGIAAVKREIQQCLDGHGWAWKNESLS